MSPKLFISHAHHDRALADRFVELLETTAGLNDDDYFLSSAPGRGPEPGRYYVESIRDHFAASTVAVALLSHAFLGSAFCGAELGAVWCTPHLPFFPFTVPPLDHSGLNGVLVGVQASSITNVAELTRLTQFVTSHFAHDERDQIKVRQRIERFVNDVGGMLDDAPPDPGPTTNGMLAHRDDVDGLVGPVANRIRALGAGQRLLFSGTDCAFLRGPLSNELEFALSRGVQIRAMCVDPTLPDTSLDVIPERDSRFADIPRFRSEVEASIEAFRGIAGRGSPGAFQLRLFQHVPALHYFITDPDHWRGSFKVESYQPSRDTRDATRDEILRRQGRPHWIVPPEMQSWRKALLAGWEFDWARARPVI